MSALKNFWKKAIVTTTILAAVPLASGCGMPDFGGSDAAPVLEDVKDGSACYRVIEGSEPLSVEFHWYGSEYQNHNTEHCLTDAEALDRAERLEEIALAEKELAIVREERAAAEEASYQSNLPIYRSALDAEIGTVSEPADTLWQVVSFYCTTSREGGASLRALWEASEDVYNANWSVEAESLWHSDFVAAVEAHCWETAYRRAPEVNKLAEPLPEPVPPAPPVGE